MSLQATQRLCHPFPFALLIPGRPSFPAPTQTQKMGDQERSTDQNRLEERRGAQSPIPPHPLLQSCPKPPNDKGPCQSQGKRCWPRALEQRQRVLRVPNSAAALITVVSELGVQPQTKQIRTKTTGFLVPLILSQQLLKDPYN